MADTDLKYAFPFLINALLRDAKGLIMTLYLLALLAIVQGITEFLPISSSAHLILIHRIAGVTADDLALDVAVHIGSIFAVILYFRVESLSAFAGLWHIARRRNDTPQARLAGLLIMATVPAVVFGAFLALSGYDGALRSVTVIGWTMILFGIALWWFDRVSPQAKTAPGWSWRDAAIMGLWQAVALIPGVSRSGITMTSARALGYERHEAARLSMLMSIPITLATGGLLGLRAVEQGGLSPDMLGGIAIAAALSFIAAYGALAMMMRFLSKVSFTPYVIYRIALGLLLLALAYS